MNGPCLLANTQGHVDLGRYTRNCEHRHRKWRAKQSQYVLLIIIFALIIKLSLFAFAAVHAPQGKLLPDSQGYLKLSDMLASMGVFANQEGSGNLIYETFRTPGYPLFLAIFHVLMKIPLDGIILIQIAMTLLTAFITYKTALEIAPKIAFLSAAIILYDPPITIFSLTILTESLFLLLISLFMFNFMRYLKNRNVGYAILSALILAVTTYVRPVSYYLGFFIALFIIYANGRQNFKKAFAHAMIFVLIVYSLLGIWQVRNYMRCHDTGFCRAERSDLSTQGLFKSYTRNTDPYTKNMAPLPYYINASLRSLVSLMTRPGNFKYFECEPLTIAGLILGYPWMVFWLSGFIIGVIRMRRSIYIQFMLLVALYFIITSIGAQMWIMGTKLRVAMMPFIAIISAYGWVSLRRHWRSEATKQSHPASNISP